MRLGNRRLGSRRDSDAPVGSMRNVTISNVQRTGIGNRCYHHVSWQLWSCIRHTKCGGNTRLFYAWEGKTLTDKDWKPMGIAMLADEKLGETTGGMQAPHVIFHDGLYHMFYGDWVNICHATSKDGKEFTRVVQPNGTTGMFTQGIIGHARDAMVLPVGNKWLCYYTAHSKRSPETNLRGVNYCRVSSDLNNWGEARVVAEGNRLSTGPYCAECPHVVYHRESAHYYLFNTQNYNSNGDPNSRQRSTVYRSPDPFSFGASDNSLEVTTLEVAAPEIILHDGRHYIAALNIVGEITVLFSCQSSRRSVMATLARRQLFPV